MMPQNETFSDRESSSSRPRLFFVDVLRLLSMIAIAHFHIHEATFYSNQHHLLNHGFLELPLEHYSRFMAFSGFTIVFVSYFLIGWIGLSIQKLKQLLSVVVLGIFTLFIVYFEESHLALEWDIYHFIGVASLCLAVLTRIPLGLLVGSLVSVVLIALPPETWIFPSLQDRWFYSGVFGSYHLHGGGSWPLVPWVGLPIIGFSLGKMLRLHPHWEKYLYRIHPFEVGLWTLSFLVSLPFLGAYYPVPIGPDFYQFVQNVDRPAWVAHMLFVLFFIRLGFVQSLNQWALSRPALAWISNLYLNRRFFFFYIVSWILIGIFSNFEAFYINHWPVFDWVVFGLFPLTEFVCHCLLKASREILGFLRTHLRAAP